MADNDSLVAVSTVGKTEPIARIALNGYNIEAGTVFGRSGSMRSFRMVQGDLWNEWHQQSLLTITDDGGAQSTIRIYAWPAEAGASGFVEFV
jgi:hypothetical protein